MADPQIVNTLRAKRAEIEASIAYLKGKLKEAEIDHMHVSAVLRLYEIGPDPQVQFPAHANLSRVFKRGELTALSREALAVSGEPMTTRELALYVVRAKGLDTDDKRLRSAVAYRLVQALGIAAKRGAVQSAGKRKGVRVWSAQQSRFAESANHQ